MRIVGDYVGAGVGRSAEHGFALHGADSPECAHLKTSCVSCVVLGEVKGISIVMDHLKFYFLFDKNRFFRNKFK